MNGPFLRGCTTALSMMDGKHAENVYGMPPFGPRQSTEKRKTPEDLEDGTDPTAESIQDSTNGDMGDALCGIAAGHDRAAGLDIACTSAGA
ncbi:hypothetical protein DDE82_004176 [Stemphylium lycopersici]|nr:hypothetical protein DDE82_004176 [Stemphylium lycopersici]